MLGYVSIWVNCWLPAGDKAQFQPVTYKFTFAANLVNYKSDNATLSGIPPLIRIPKVQNVHSQLIFYLQVFE